MLPGGPWPDPRAAPSLKAPLFIKHEPQRQPVHQVQAACNSSHFFAFFCKLHCSGHFQWRLNCAVCVYRYIYSIDTHTHTQSNLTMEVIPSIMDPLIKTFQTRAVRLEVIACMWLTYDEGSVSDHRLAAWGEKKERRDKKKHHVSERRTQRKGNRFTLCVTSRARLLHHLLLERKTR